MNRAQKTELATSLQEKFSKAAVVVMADYKGLKAADADTLRRSLREHKVEVKVLKNNIFRQITKDGSMGEGAKTLANDLVGPTLAAFAYGDPAAAAKVIHKFSEDNEALKLKDSLMGQRKIQASEIEALAKLPSREILLGMLLGALNGTARGFVSVLAAVPRDFVGVLAAIERKKRESGEQ